MNFQKLHLITSLSIVCFLIGYGSLPLIGIPSFSHAAKSLCSVFSSNSYERLHLIGFNYAIGPSSYFLKNRKAFTLSGFACQKQIS